MQTVIKISLEIPIEIEPDGDSFHAFSPILKGLHTAGKNEYLARQHIKDGAKAYIQSLINHGEPLPKLAVR